MPPIETFSALISGISWWDHDTEMHPRGLTTVDPNPTCGESICAAHCEATANTESSVSWIWTRSAAGRTRPVLGCGRRRRNQWLAGSERRGLTESAEESHAVIEWAGRPGLDAVRKMITDRMPFGVVEMKTAWVTDDPERKRTLTKTLARSGVPDDGSAGRPVLDGDGGNPRSGVLAFVGRCGGIEDSCDTLSGCTVTGPR